MAPFSTLTYNQTANGECSDQDTRDLKVAKAAIKEVFFMLGVDIHNPKEVEDFRKDLRFGGTMRRRADKGVMLLIGAILTMLVGFVGNGLWESFKSTFGNGQ